MDTDFLRLIASVQDTTLENSCPTHSTWLSKGGVQFLALCLTTLGWLTIVTTTGQAAESYQETEAALQLVCTQQADHFVCNPASDELPTGMGTSAITATIVPQFFTPTEQSTISDVLLCVTYLLPLGLGLGIFLYDRYANYRAALLRQQINVLERIWQRSTTH